jgi:hypothetical protein
MMVARDKSTWSKEALARLALRVDQNSEVRENYEVKQKVRLSKMEDTFKRY